MTLYHHFKLVLRGVVKLDMNSSKYGTRYDDQLNRAGEWLLTLNDERAFSWKRK